MADSSETTANSDQPLGAEANPAADIDQPRVAHLVLNQNFVEANGPRGVQAYVDAVVSMAGDVTDDEDADAAELQRRMDRGGLVLPEESYRNITRQLRDARGQVAISTDAGEMLYGPERLAPAVHEPDVRGTDDPEHPDRPAIM